MTTITVCSDEATFETKRRRVVADTDDDINELHCRPLYMCRDVEDFVKVTASFTNEPDDIKSAGFLETMLRYIKHDAADINNAVLWVRGF